MLSTKETSVTKIISIKIKFKTLLVYKPPYNCEKKSSQQGDMPIELAGKQPHKLQADIVKLAEL